MPNQPAAGGGNRRAHAAGPANASAAGAGIVKLWLMKRAAPMGWCDMARSRNIKPGLFKNEILGVADPLYTLAFQGLWLLADRAGRLEDRPLRIKAETFPYRDGLDIDRILNWLEEEGFILRYEASGKRYIQVLNFSKHQNPHKNETASDIPPPDLSEAVPKNSVHIPKNSEALGLIPDSGFRIPSLLIPDVAADAAVASKQATEQRPACPAEEIVSLYHEMMPMNPRVKVLTDTRKKAIRARWKEAATLTCKPFGYSSREEGVAAWRYFFEVCADSDFLTGNAPPQPGKPPFIADIDFLMSPSGFVKCLEEKYHREAA